MTEKCPRPECFAPRTTCADGAVTHKECRHFRAGDRDAAVERTSAEAGSEYAFPWTGNTFGLMDLHLLAANSRPKLIGVIGPESSGKTSMLAVSYLLVFNGLGLGGRRFAGSLTLDAWEQISSYFKFQGYDLPSFPPHTASGEGRVPGLLHLVLGSAETSDELLITDPPGAWFERWLDNVDDPQAEGARWIAQNATHFVFVVDSELLLADRYPVSKYKVLNLAARLASVRGGRPVAVVWSKADNPVDGSVKETMRTMLAEQLTQAEYFDVSVEEVDPLVERFQALWKWLLDAGGATPVQTAVAAGTGDLFLRFRG